MLRKAVLALAFAIYSSAVLTALPALAQENCNTKNIGISDFVDPNGLPSGRDGPKPLTVDSTLIVFQVYGSPKDPPLAIPSEWQIRGGAVWDNLIFYENGVTLEYRILRFENPLSFCGLIGGWESWNEYRKKIPNFLYREAHFVFLRDGEPYVLTNSIDLTLGPGVSPNEFKTKVFEKELVMRLNALNEPIGYLDRGNFDAKIDLNTGLWKVRVWTADGVFPLRAANRIAAYGTFGQPGWISRVNLVFRPLVSQVQFSTKFEQLQLSGPPILMRKGEPISVPQLSAPGIRINVAVDIARDSKGNPLFRVLTDPGEYFESLVKAFEPKLDKSQIAKMGSGCAKSIIPAPNKKYERTLFSCIFSVLAANDYRIHTVSFRLVSLADGNDYVVSSGDEDLLLHVFTLRQKDQENGVIGVRPLPNPAVSSFAAKKIFLAKPIAALPAEPAVRFLERRLVPPVNALAKEFWKNPWETIRTKIFMDLLALALIGIILIIVFGRWFKLPSLFTILIKSVRFVLIAILAGVLLPLATFFLCGLGLRFFFYILTIGKRAKNLTLEVLANAWHIALPAEPESLIPWALNDERTLLEKVVAAFYAGKLLARKTLIVADSDILLSLRVLEEEGLNIVLGPFVYFALRREIRRRETLK